LLKGYDYDNKIWTVIWQGKVQDDVRDMKISRIFSPIFPVTKFKTNRLRITMDCTNAISWIEIDAVRLRGRENYTWSLEYHHRYPKLFQEKTVLFWTCSHSGLTKDIIYYVFNILSKLFDLDQ